MKNIIIGAVILFVACINASAQWRGDLDIGETLDLKFATVGVSSGIPTTLVGGIVTCFKDNVTTGSVAGVALTADFGARTGSNHLRITTASDATFYSVGSYFDCIITTGTVNSVSVVGMVVASFSVGKFASISTQASTNLNTFFDNSAATSTAVVDNIAKIKTVQKNVAFSNFPIWMLTGAAAPVTNIMPACQIQKDSGMFVASSNAATEVGIGKYSLNLTATETNADVMSIVCTGAGSVPYRTVVTPQH